MDSVQTLVWLSGTPIGRVLEHSDEEWLTAIGRQVRAKKEKDKEWLDRKRKEYDDWINKYEDYLKWCENSNKKPSTLNHLKYKFRNKSEKGNQLKQREQAERSDAASGAASGKSESATEQPLTETLQSQKSLKDAQPQSSTQTIDANAASNTTDDPNGQPDDVYDITRKGDDEVKTTSLTVEQKIEEIEKQIAVLTIKIDGVKET